MELEAYDESIVDRTQNKMKCTADGWDRHDSLLKVVKLWGNTGERHSPSVFGGGMLFP